MSYWFEREKLRVGKERDRRRKLDDFDKELIRQLYKRGMSSKII
jgi:hypothetical protein